MLVTSTCYLPEEQWQCELSIITNTVKTDVQHF